MIAKTFLGNNLLGLGLISHFTAMIIGMLAIQNAGVISAVLYFVGYLFFMLGIFLELQTQQNTVLKNWHFYTSSVLALFPIVGPIITFVLLYKVHNARSQQSKTLTGFITSIFALKVHPILLMIWSITIAIALAFTFQQHDPYFSYPK